MDIRFLRHIGLRLCSGKRLAALSMGLLLGGCAVGPDYRVPDIAVGHDYKETQGWTKAQPNDDGLRGDWWKLFNDPQLSDLMQTLLVSNQNIAEVQARYRQAQALLQSAGSAFFPTVGVGASVT